MLTQTDNELLCRVSPGTPMGQLFRRFWLPVLLKSELDQPDGAPVRVRVLGENLVAFRDTEGAIALVAENCPHRGASLFFGRNEESGLRCVYHGWKFDTSGACIDMPNEPPESNFKQKVRVAAYPGVEYGGLIWAYLGPAGQQPELPQLEWARVPEPNRSISCWLNESSWLQIMEGDVDTSHSMFLHSAMDPALQQASRRLDIMKDRSPRILVKQTDYGMAYAGRYNTVNGDYVWRVTQWLMPSNTMIASRQFPYNGRVYVPIDDTHTMIFSYLYNPDAPITPDQSDAVRSGFGANVETRLEPFQFPDGSMLKTHRPVRSKYNDYEIDREMQRTRNFTGIWGVQNQDLAMTESMGSISNRTREHLGTADTAIIAMRRRLLALVRDLEKGVTPVAAYDGSLHHIRSHDSISEEADFERFLQSHQQELLAEV